MAQVKFFSDSYCR